MICEIETQTIKRHDGKEIHFHSCKACGHTSQDMGALKSECPYEKSNDDEPDDTYYGPYPY